MQKKSFAIIVKKMQRVLKACFLVHVRNKKGLIRKNFNVNFQKCFFHLRKVTVNFIILQIEIHVKRL